MITAEELSRDPFVREILLSLAPARLRGRPPCIGGLQRNCSQTNARLLVEELLRRLEDCETFDEQEYRYPRDDHLDELLRAVRARPSVVLAPQPTAVQQLTVVPQAPQPTVVPQAPQPTTVPAECKESKKYKKEAKELRELNEELRGALKDSAKTIERIVAARPPAAPAPAGLPPPTVKETPADRPPAAPPAEPVETEEPDVSTEIEEITAAPDCAETEAERAGVAKILKSVNIFGRLGSDVPCTVRSPYVQGHLGRLAHQMDNLYAPILRKCPDVAARRRYSIAADRLARRYMCQASAFVGQKTGIAGLPCTDYTAESVRAQDETAQLGVQDHASAKEAIAFAREALQELADVTLEDVIRDQAKDDDHEKYLAGLWCLAGTVPTRECPDARTAALGQLAMSADLQDQLCVRDHDAVREFGRKIREVNAEA